MISREKVIDLIHERIDSAKENLNGHKDQNSVGFGYDMGAFDELRYLRDEIMELK